MRRKGQYADDWVTISEGVEYSKRHKLYWANGQVYDERSAQHNGIIGMGATLKSMSKALEQ